MTDYRKTTGKGSNTGRIQTGFLGLGELDASAELVSMDPSAPVDKKDGLNLTVDLSHNNRYVDDSNPNRCDPDNAEAINVGAFIAGAGGAAASAATISAIPVPGARPVALASLAAGGVASVGKGWLADFTGGFQFSIRVKAKKKGEDKWYQLGHYLPCVPTAGVLGDAKRTVDFNVYSPPSPGIWDVEVIMETKGGTQLNKVTKEIEVTESSRSSEADESGGSNFNQWILDNPAKAAGMGLFGLVTTRAVIDNSLGGQ